MKIFYKLYYSSKMKKAYTKLQANSKLLRRENCITFLRKELEDENRALIYELSGLKSAMIKKGIR